MKKSQAFKNRDAVTRQISEETDNTGYKKTKYQVTTAYIFDYDSLGISIDYILSSENDGLMISEAQVVDIEEKKDLPF
jgi:hypothetical protein